MKKISVVGMIYKSPIYLNFMLDSLRKFTPKVFGDFHVELVVIANDATDNVKQALVDSGVKWIDYKDPRQQDYYLNRVYRAWNYGGFNVDGDIIVFVNSDMAFSNLWLENLIVNLNDKTIPCSRLVESGKLLSGKWVINQDFGKTPGTFNADAFYNYSEHIKVATNFDGGLYMPCAFYKQEFMESGGYPEGNICVDGIGKFPSKVLQSGDRYFFENILSGKKHITVGNSIVYHIQQGELDV